MSKPEMNEDRTRVRIPSRADKRIPDRYSASIVILEGYAEGMEYPVTKAYTVIGRDKSADIALKDPSISRQHAAVLFADGEFWLKDLGSTNGTLFKGAVVEQTVLRHRDKFQIGDTIIQFILEDTGDSRVYEVRDEE